MIENLTVVILSFNEERNIPYALKSARNWASNVLVIDSLSSDNTRELAIKGGARVLQREFDNYANQRNFALREGGITTEWVFFLDADEWLTEELKEEIQTILASHPVENGFWIKRRFYWMGTWIRRGYYPTWLLRLGRTSKMRCENRKVNEHLIVEGQTGKLNSDFVDENRNGIERWHLKHLQYAKQEALITIHGMQREGDFFGNLQERKRWFYTRIWVHLPLFLRPLLYFGYRFIIRGGFLEGRKAFLYHFYQALWFQMLIDTYIHFSQSRPNAEADAKEEN